MIPPLDRAWHITENNRWKSECLHLSKVFQNDGYSQAEIKWAFHLVDKKIKMKRIEKGRADPGRCGLRWSPFIKA